jgi:hypothetical protein
MRRTRGRAIHGARHAPSGRMTVRRMNHPSPPLFDIIGSFERREFRHAHRKSSRDSISDAAISDARRRPGATRHRLRSTGQSASTTRLRCRDPRRGTASDVGVAPMNGGDATEGEMAVHCPGPSRARTARDERQGWLFCVSGAMTIHFPRDPKLQPKETHASTTPRQERIRRGRCRARI